MKHLVEKQIAISIATLQAMLAEPDVVSTLVTVGGVTAQAMRDGRKLMVAGNGGSAADAQHIVAEFVARLVFNRPALRAVALTVDSSILTAVGNDFGFEDVFSRQIEALGQPGDVFLAISTSGNSKNLIKALKQAREQGVITVGLTGSGGGKMRELCDHNLIVPSSTTMNIQECHLVLEHIFCMLVERCYFGPEFETTYTTR